MKDAAIVLVCALILLFAYRDGGPKLVASINAWIDAKTAQVRAETQCIRQGEQ